MSRFGRIRRRPDHWPTAHARARARAAERLDGPLGLAEASWLDDHLAGCAECSAIAASYDADRLALRGLLDTAPEPPRDLWARTSAAIEREARPRSARPAGARRPSVGWPLTALSGVAVAAIVVVVGAVSTGLLADEQSVAFLDDGGPAPSGPVAVASGPAPSDVPPSTAPEPTPLLANAGDVAWIRRSAGGVLAFTNAPIGQVCPTRGESGCASLDEAAEQHFDLTIAPRSIIGSPVDDRAVVVTDDGTGGDRIFVVSLPDRERGGGPRPTPEPGATPTPTPTPTPTDEPTATPTAPIPTPDPATPTPTPDATPTDEPTVSPTPQPIVTPEPTVATSLAIASDILVVGESASFSPDGTWFAFTARPRDGSGGPDVFTWRIGDQAAVALTEDGASTFASWSAGSVIVSRPVDATAVDGAAALSLTIDPVSGTETAIEGALWRPAVDPSGVRAVAWVGSVAFDAAGAMWRPSDGRLELLAWPPTPAPDPSASPDPGATAGQVLIEGPIADLDIRWDETGEWVAVWIAESLESDVGRLTLFRVDPTSGLLDQPADAPTEEPALAGFSIGLGRLAWVGPEGVNGEGSQIHVAAWVGRDVGTAESAPGAGIVVVR